MHSYRHLLIYVLVFLLVNKETYSKKKEPFPNDELADEQNYHEFDWDPSGLQQHDEDKEKGPQVIKDDDVVRLNVGGHIIDTRRKTLTKVANSTLAHMFDGSNETAVHREADGSYLLDYNPVLFSHLLDQLRIIDENETISFRPPPSSLLIKPFHKMLQDLGLPTPPKTETDIMVLNVGGEKVVTFRKTLTGVPGSNLALLASLSKDVKRDRLGRPFLDYNPNLFRHLLDQLRGGKNIEDCTLYAPSAETQSTFELMVNALRTPKSEESLPRQTKKKSRRKNLEDEALSRKPVGVPQFVHLTVPTPEKRRRRAAPDLSLLDKEVKLVDDDLDNYY